MNHRLQSTRLKIVQLLRRAQQSVNEMAAALDLTDNAVRTNLAMLERDGLVRRVGNRASFRKPETVYDVTAAGEHLFSKAYEPVLGTLLGVMESGLDEEKLKGLITDAGRRLAEPYLPSLAGLPFDERAPKTLRILQDLGGLADVEERDGSIFVRGLGCPFSQIATQHPKVCLLMQSLVSELLGCPVKEQCQRGERPKCGFVVE